MKKCLSEMEYGWLEWALGQMVDTYGTADDGCEEMPIRTARAETGLMILKECGSLRIGDYLVEEVFIQDGNCYLRVQDADARELPRLVDVRDLVDADGIIL